VTIGQFERYIDQQLFVIEQINDQLAADFARKVTIRRSPKVVGEEEENHVPDGSFTHNDATKLGVVFEASQPATVCGLKHNNPYFPKIHSI